VLESKTHQTKEALKLITLTYDPVNLPPSTS
jgi:hypothetical protein